MNILIILCQIMPKPFSFSGNLTNVIFFFNKAKKSIIAVVMIDFFNAVKGKKNELKNRKAMWFGYITVLCQIEWVDQ